MSEESQELGDKLVSAIVEDVTNNPGISAVWVGLEEQTKAAIVVRWKEVVAQELEKVKDEATAEFKELRRKETADRMNNLQSVVNGFFPKMLNELGIIYVEYQEGELKSKNLEIVNQVKSKIEEIAGIVKQFKLPKDVVSIINQDRGLEGSLK